ncbi:phage head closure protein [Alcaligenes endophyticus]|uniref:Phage head closure protein n=1 Tax=Alcaligenes endophyticus TaxID=1929088 RepID=A0ABT8EK90_9BURK|nr:phage head closure protein [Alcaligenes endophyticus]MCX5592028.1 phage head closure protein [Alcaligenes endophyticus]MDN4121718.1 phage head closure protein [Alcaligenes endophyticus]
MKDKEGLAAGLLNRRIIIQQREGVQDAAGQPTTAWVTVATAWAWIKGPTGMAVAKGGLLGQSTVDDAVSPYSFRIRYRVGVKKGMRVVLRGEVYEVREVRHDQEGAEWTDLVCKHGVKNG